MARTALQRNRSARATEPLNIFILGDLGAGKGTQSQLLQALLPLYEIDMGIEQEKQRRTDKVLDAIYRRTVDLGKLAPTTVYRRLVRNAIARVPKTQGIIFAGHPKMPDEVRYVHQLLKRMHRTMAVAIYITIPWKETVRRNLSRKGYFGDKKRADDSLEAIKIRKFNAQASLRASRSVYKELYPYAQISGMGSVEEVHSKVVAALKRLIKKAHSSNETRTD